MRSLLLTTTGVLALGACGANAARVAQWNQQKLSDLRTRAAFDMHCDQELRTTELKKNENGAVTIAGVDGCGQRSTYLYDHYRDLWVMDTASADSNTSASKEGTP